MLQWLHGKQQQYSTIKHSLKAANADLDVEVELVDDIAAILQQQNQPSILKYPSTQHIPENQELLLLRQSEQRY